MNSVVSQRSPETSSYIAGISSHNSGPLSELCLDRLSSDQQRALERDLVLASQVQRGLLPKTDLRSGNWRIHYQYKSEGIVSGDYCDVIPRITEDGGLIFLLGDVSGKGVAASLLMTHLHATFRSLASIGLDFDQLLEIANRIFCESTMAGLYAMLVCGRVGATGEIEIASAGHLPGLHVSKNGVQEIGATGLPLGLFGSSRYSVQRFRLEPGDTLLLYTDGISETRDAEGNEFGIDGLTLAAAGLHSFTAEELITVCRESVERFSSGARQLDDQTLMAIHFEGDR
jgi:sigma-B regulation protein RsbU (phosphoserine phosphatase)